MDYRNAVVRLILLLNALLHLYFGAVFIVSPEPMMANLSIAATSPAGLIEMRTFYGGLMFAMGCFFMLGAIKFWIAQPAVIMLILTYLAAVLTRSAGLALEPIEAPIIWQILYVEIAGLVSGLLAIKILVGHGRKS